MEAYQRLRSTAAVHGSSLKQLAAHVELLNRRPREWRARASCHDRAKHNLTSAQHRIAKYEDK